MAAELETAGHAVHYVVVPNKIENDIDNVTLQNLLNKTICTDKEQIMQCLEKLCLDKFDYIYPLFPDNLLVDISAFNTMYDMPGIKSVSAKHIVNKSSYYKIWNELDILTPQVYETVGHLNELDELPVDINFPCIVKPSSGYCSLGVQIIDNIESLFRFFKDTDVKLSPFQESHNQKYKSLQYLSFGSDYLIQEYISGRLISISGVVKNNKIDIDFFYEIESDCYPYAAETGFIYPSDLDTNDLREKIVTSLNKFFKHIQLDNSPFMLDVIMMQGNLYFIDFAARASAVSYRLFLYSNQKDYTVKLVDKILNDKTYTLEMKPCILRVIPFKQGIIESVEFPDAELADKINYPKSKQIRLLRNDLAVNNNGSIIVSGDSLSEAEEKFKRIIETAKIQYKK